MFSVYWHTLQVFWLPSLKIFLGLSFYGFFVIEFQKILIILSNILAFLPFGDLIRHVYTSVQLSWSVMSDSLWPHELQHARPPCPSPTPRVYPNSCSSSWWYHLILCHSLLLLPSIFPASGSVPISRLFASGGQSIGVSTLASALLMNIQGSFPLGLTGLISLTVKSLLQYHNSKSSILLHSAFFMVQLSHPYMTAGKTTVLFIRTFADKLISLLFNTL